jgi:Kelch motif
MKRALPTFPIAFLFISSLALAACNSISGPSTAFTISGTVVNLAGTNGGLVLQNNLTNNLPVNANGTFTFTETVASGSPYSVTIAAQPSNPAQTCGVTSGSGIATAGVTNIEVDCGHNEWKWVSGPNTVVMKPTYGTLGVPAADTDPDGRQLPVTWADASGNFWLAEGYGDDSTGTLNPLNDLWEYTNGQWVWMGGPNVGAQKGIYGSLGVPAMSNIPGARYQAARWTDSSGDLWLFGGYGFDSQGNQSGLDDLWKYSAGEWTWMGGSDLTDQVATYGALGVPAAANTPGSRFGAVTWTDSSGNFWLFGGFTYASTGHGMLSDLWKFSNGEWTWESGSTLTNQSGVYDAKGIPSPSNLPGARYWGVGWTDSSGNLWLFGGAGFDSLGNEGFLNDLWKYSNGQWTWVSGPSVVNQPGVYGTQGMPAPGSIPGSRQQATAWTDSSGNFWLFSGNGIDSASGTGLLNDLWKYSNGEWTWMSGANVINQNGVYGTLGTLAPGNIPGARFVANSWIDANGNLWLFAGNGMASGAEGYLGDVWMYMP